MKKIMVLIACIYSGIGSAATNVAVNIGGEVYSISLLENAFLTHRLSASSAQGVGEHYIGTLHSFPDAWARLSFINNTWQGVVYIHDDLHFIDQVNPQEMAGFALANSVLPTEPASAHSEILGGCGVVGESSISSMMAEIQNAVIAQATFSEFCEVSDQVGGVCILPEIDFVFDTAFRELFSTDEQAEAEAAAIINIAEGFYVQDRDEADDDNGFNMAFDYGPPNFLTSEVFSTTLNSRNFLMDIQVQKAAGLSFVENNRALLHVITGRTFEGNTVGIAYVGSVCNANGFSSGTSTYVGNAALTAIVVAHELAHNLGSEHDGPVTPRDPNSNSACPGNTHIMSRGVDPSLQGFSDCSVDDIESRLAALSVPELCFNFPADIAVSEIVGPAELSTGEVYNASYTVSVDDEGDRAVTQLLIEGNSNIGSQFMSVSANGMACTISPASGYEDLAYSCNVSAAIDDVITIDITSMITGFDINATSTHMASVATANVTDFLVANNTITKSIMVSGPIVNPPPPNFNMEDDLANADGNNGGSSGSGGGGSLDWPLLAFFATLLYCRRYGITENADE